MVLEHVVHHLQQAITQKDYETAKTLLKKAQAIDAASALITSGYGGVLTLAFSSPLTHSLACTNAFASGNTALKSR